MNKVLGKDHRYDFASRAKNNYFVLKQSFGHGADQLADSNDLEIYCQV